MMNSVVSEKGFQQGNSCLGWRILSYWLVLVLYSEFYKKVKGR